MKLAAVLLTGSGVPPLKAMVFDAGLVTVVKYWVVPASFQMLMLPIAV